jgi:D-glycero-D-manno-heptose 1,7-bisphosphate phosphatase
MGKPAVFLDRDGTINVEAGYIHDLANLHLMPGAADAIKRLNDMGVPAILATNQSGPARGYYPETWVHTLNNRVAELLEAGGARLDDMFYCPHLPDGTVSEYTLACRCRKPETGMLDDAAAKHGLDLSVSYMIGDKSTDVEVGQRAGCRTVLLRSGFGERVLSGEYQWAVTPDFVADTLVEAIEWVVTDLAAREKLTRG